jgi:hypothetical protein
MLAANKRAEKYKCKERNLKKQKKNFKEIKVKEFSNKVFQNISLNHALDFNSAD